MTAPARAHSSRMSASHRHPACLLVLGLLTAAWSCSNDEPRRDGPTQNEDPAQSDDDDHGDTPGDGDGDTSDGDQSVPDDGMSGDDGSPTDDDMSTDGDVVDDGPGDDWNGDGDGDGDGTGDGDADGDGTGDYTDVSRCNDGNLDWRSASRTWFESYPKPGSSECEDFSGCKYRGLFAACGGDRKSEEWVAEHNIVAAFPSFRDLELHDLCLRQNGQFIVVTVLDTCGDHDCGGCCTRNQDGADQLIDLEIHTHDRFDVGGGDMEWADLGPTQGPGCD
jgi:hypothetical protein